jgi:hypothetical protein
MRFVRRFVVLAIIVGVGVKLLRSLGLLGGGECDPGCGCSRGQIDCTCGHATCLAPDAA